jgi:acyl-CoA reductase-like NAD-dependent aldehyde dehydrogenase
VHFNLTISHDVRLAPAVRQVAERAAQCAGFDAADAMRLAASVGHAAETLLSRVAAGSVYWNCCDRVSPRLPWSGVKHSGIGLTLSTMGIQTFTRPKAWHLKG